MPKLLITLIIIILFSSCKEKNDNSTREVRVKYYDGDTILKKIISFDKYAQFDGVIISSNKNGKIERLEYYKENKLDGERFYFFENGKLESKINYMNGKKHGNSMGFYESGNKRYEMSWNNNLPTNTAIEYFDSPNKEKTLIRYDEKGQINYREEKDTNGHIISVKGNKKF